MFFLNILYSRYPGKWGVPRWLMIQVNIAFLILSHVDVWVPALHNQRQFALEVLRKYYKTWSKYYAKEMTKHLAKQIIRESILQKLESLKRIEASKFRGYLSPTTFPK